MEKEMEKLMKIKFLMFENEANLCWLDASLAILAHNRTLRKIVENSPESQINKIISAYDEAVNIFNNSDSEQKKLKTKKVLFDIQNSTLNYLQQFLKFKDGQPDSAFCALLNLVYRDKSKIKKYLNASWIWRKQCSSCGVNSKSGTCLKPIITLSKVDTFHPECPTSLYVCTCKSEQEMRLIYKELPPCLIFHFEKGVATGTNFPINFSMKGREYQLTSIVILEKSSEHNLNHFITWIRNPIFNIWLECNDLNTGFAKFTKIKPEFDLKDVYIAVFEAFDNLDRINNDELSADQEQDIENSNVELIDLSDESDGGNADSKEKPCNNSNQNVSASDLKFTSEIPHNEHKIKTESKDFDSQHNAVDKFIEFEEFKSKTADYKDNEVEKDSIVIKNEMFLNPIVTCKTSTVENLEIHSKEKIKDNEEESINSSQNISVCSFSLPNKISLIKHAITTESDNFESQNKSSDNSLTVESINNEKHTVTDVSSENDKISSLLNSASFGEDISVDDTSYKELFFGKKSTQNVSISNPILDDKADARENEVSRYGVNKFQLKMTALEENKTADDTSYKELFFGKESTQNVSIPDPILEDKSDARESEVSRYSVNKLQLKMKTSLEENKTADDTSYKEPFFGKKSTQNVSIPDPVLEDKADERENEVNRYGENKLQLKIKQTLEENKCIRPNEENGKKVENRYITASKRKGERTHGKYVSSDKGKNVVIMNDERAGTSWDSNKISENIYQSSSISNGINCRKRKSEVSGNKNFKEFKKTNNAVNKQSEKYRRRRLGTLRIESRERLSSMIDTGVTFYLASYFVNLNEARENNLNEALQNNLNEAHQNNLTQ